MPYYEVYDKLSSSYDKRYESPGAFAENVEIQELINSLAGPSATMLDVGAGTGLALELGLTEEPYFTGIEPSVGMAIHCLKKFPRVGNFFVGTFEAYVDKCIGQDEAKSPDRPPFDIVISLFGSPSYIPANYLWEMLKLGEKVVMMHYIDGYLPDYEENNPYLRAQAEGSRACAERMAQSKGRLFQLNKFQVTVFGEDK